MESGGRREVESPGSQIRGTPDGKSAASDDSPATRFRHEPTSDTLDTSSSGGGGGGGIGGVDGGGIGGGGGGGSGGIGGGGDGGGSSGVSCGGIGIGGSGGISSGGGGGEGTSGTCNGETDRRRSCIGVPRPELETKWSIGGRSVGGDFGGSANGCSDGKARPGTPKATKKKKLSSSLLHLPTSSDAQDIGITPKAKRTKNAK